MMKKSMRRRAGLAMAGFALAANVPFLLLTDRFGYDDVLREPPLDVLRAFQAGGPELILIWLGFALCALSFLWVSAWTGEVLKAGGNWPAWATAAGAASAVAQAIGLSRWTFVVPGLADRALSGDPIQGAAAVAVYQGLHQFAGVAIGEWLGQTLLAAWTLAMGLALARGGPPARDAWTRALGFMALVLSPLWILGQTELLATVDPAFPDFQITQWVFTAWLVWLLALGVTWLVQGETT